VTINQGSDAFQYGITPRNCPNPKQQAHEIFLSHQNFILATAV